MVHYTLSLIFVAKIFVQLKFISLPNSIFKADSESSYILTVTCLVWPINSKNHKICPEKMVFDPEVPFKIEKSSKPCTYSE